MKLKRKTNVSGVYEMLWTIRKGSSIRYLTEDNVRLIECWFVYLLKLQPNGMNWQNLKRCILCSESLIFMSLDEFFKCSFDIIVVVDPIAMTMIQIITLINMQNNEYLAGLIFSLFLSKLLKQANKARHSYTPLEYPSVTFRC